MKYVPLGSSGLQVSRVCLGMMSYGDRTERTWHLDEAEAEPVVRRAVGAGVTFFDTADMYSNGRTEEITGSLLRKFFPSREGRKRASCDLPPGADALGIGRPQMKSGVRAPRPPYLRVAQ